MLLNVRLLQRTTRRVSLTVVGQEVLTRAIGLLDGYDELTALISLSANEPAGRVCMSAPAAYARRFVGPALASFFGLYPRIRVDLRAREGPADVVADQVDIALCLGAGLGPSMIARRVIDIEVGLFASLGYLQRSGWPDHPNDMLRHNCLICDDAGTGRHWHLHHPGSGVDIELPVRGALQSSQAEMLVSAAVHGAGIVSLPAFMVEDAVVAGRLERRLPGWICPPLALQLAYSPSRSQPLAVRKLIDHLLATLGTADDVESAGAPLVVRPVQRGRITSALAA